VAGSVELAAAVPDIELEARLGLRFSSHGRPPVCRLRTGQPRQGTQAQTVTVPAPGRQGPALTEAAAHGQARAGLRVKSESSS
jgi:hypothetical protein